MSNPTVIGPSGPGVTATLALQIEEGFKLKLSFATDVRKHRDGTEQRGGQLTLPRQNYAGTVYQAGSDVTAHRGLLARYAAAGAAFLLGLPHEALSLRANASGAVLAVTSTSLVDWCVPGQRVLVMASDYSSSVVGVIQTSTSNTITIDVAPGSIGNLGGTVMPAVPIYLDAQQGFVRYPAPGAPELWNLAARGIMFGYESGSNISAALALSGLTGGSLHSAILYFSVAGSIGNGVSLTLVAGGSGAGSMTISGSAYTFHFQAGTTTLQNLYNALALTPLRFAGGPLPASSTALQNTDAFGPATLAGGTDKNWGTMGNGATIATYQSRPVWTQGLAGDTVADSLQSMVELVDLGGAITQTGPATQPQFGRQVVIARSSMADWQWVKAFLYAVNGCRRAFWLATYRADLSPLQLIPGTLKISSTVGDFFGWYPKLRSYLQLIDATGAIQYLQITAAHDNGDGTISLTITSSNSAYNSGGGGATLSSFTLLSWLDLCRFESDDFEIDWTDAGFSLSTNARAVPG